MTGAGLTTRRQTLAMFAGSAAALAAPGLALGQGLPLIAEQAAAVTPRVVAWRRDIHQHPELGYRETRTAALVAEHLRGLGLDEVRTGVGRTGVLGMLRGGRPGGTVALRADMDALPIREATGLPFASTATVEIDGRSTPVMHACGHDAHTAMLMGAAQVLAGLRARISGTVLFVFQPAEEGVPGEPSGSALMLREGVFSRHRPDAVLGLHVEPGRVGEIDVRPGPFLASASSIHIVLTGRQTHGARPWEGDDLINLTADIVRAMTTLAARRVNVFEFPNVVTIAAIQAGNRGNVLPGTATLDGTIRTFDRARLEQLKRLVSEAVQNLAETYGARAEVTFTDTAAATRNDPALLETIMPAFTAAGATAIHTDAVMRGAADDFSAFLADTPGVFYILGSTPNFTSREAAPTNHSDRFDIDEAVLPLGVKTHVLTALRFLDSRVARRG